jgi:hypothetical protein
MTGLSEIDRTPLLAARKCRPHDYSAESAVLQRLASELGNPAGNVLGSLAEAALELCDADSAGISVLEPDACDQCSDGMPSGGIGRSTRDKGFPVTGVPAA